MEIKTAKKQMKEIKETCRGRGSEYNKREPLSEAEVEVE